jgi:hypothetical protein
LIEGLFAAGNPEGLSALPNSLFGNVRDILEACLESFGIFIARLSQLNQNEPSCSSIHSILGKDGVGSHSGSCVEIEDDAVGVRGDLDNSLDQIHWLGRLENCFPVELFLEEVLGGFVCPDIFREPD